MRKKSKSFAQGDPSNLLRTVLATVEWRRGTKLAHDLAACSLTRVSARSFGSARWQAPFTSSTAYRRQRTKERHRMSSPPNLSLTRAFGCRVYVHHSRPDGKLGPREWCGVFVGYDRHPGTYLIHITYLSTRKAIKSRSVEPEQRGRRTGHDPDHDQTQSHAEDDQNDNSPLPAPTILPELVSNHGGAPHRQQPAEQEYSKAGRALHNCDSRFKVVGSTSHVAQQVVLEPSTYKCVRGC